MYCLRRRVSNCSLIAPRKYLLEALRERRAANPNGLPNERVGEVGREKIDRMMGVTPKACVEWWCKNAIVQLNHDSATEDRQRTHWKSHGEIKAYDIPFWGRASKLVDIYKGRI
jgi:hypothetical protein